ncbi:MAG TPA: ABC transporter substrate-binding protein [candidate division Zixibacteria bacterium]|nr:ABC transporter substrate-binding protein [candidate division Zixibacteria bacterium]
MTCRFLRAASLVTAALFCMPAAASDKLTIGWSAIAGSHAPLWITKEAGLFERNGLDVTMIYIDGGSRATQALMSGDVPIVQVGGNAPVVARLRGADVTLIAGLLNILAYSMVVAPEIKKPEDLKGKKLSVSRFGSNSDYATRKILLKWGLRPDLDVAVLQIPGGQPARLAAIQTKQVHGMVAQPPVTNLARKMNLNILAEPEDFGGAYPTTPVASRVSYLRANRDIARRFVRALLEGIHLYKTDREFSKQVIAKYVKTSDADALEDSYRFFSRLVPAKPYPSLDAIKEALDELGEKDPKARSARPQDFADPSLVREFDESGFIDRLYRTKR